MSRKPILGCWVLVGTALLNLAGCRPKVEPKALTVWHAWPTAEVDVLSSVVADYEQRNGVAVEMVGHESQADLREALRTADAGPDLLLGPARWAPELAGRGLVGAYCLPGGCEECFGPNPPRWCLYATGKDFSHGRNADFLVTTALCEPDQCPVCFSQNPPFWCRFATRDHGVLVDFFQAGFLEILDDGVFPNGIPIWWDHAAIFSNPQWFVDQALGWPTSVKDLSEMAARYPGAVWVDPALEPDPVPWIEDVRKGDPDPQPSLEDLVKGDPSPQPNIPGIMITEARNRARLQDAFGVLLRLPLADAPAPLELEGVFVRPDSERRGEALDLAYLIADEESQEQLFQAGGRLPTSGEVWSAVADPRWVQFAQESAISFVWPQRTFELPDPRDFIEIPEREPPDFDHPDCGPAALDYWEELMEAAESVPQQVHAEFAARQGADFCARYLERCEPPLVGEQRRRFAQCFFDTRGTSGTIERCCAAGREG